VFAIKATSSRAARDAGVSKDAPGFSRRPRAIMARSTAEANEKGPRSAADDGDLATAMGCGEAQIPAGRPKNPDRQLPPGRTEQLFDRLPTATCVGRLNQTKCGRPPAVTI